MTSTWELAKLRRTISNGMESTHEVSKATHTMIDELARETGMRRRLSKFMGGLRFNEIDSRSDAIVDAESYTFEWLFGVDSREISHKTKDKPSEPPHTEAQDTDAKAASRPGFASWLQSDHSLYWITGVPGCGKSTLMKYLASHKQTTQGLQSWAGPDTKVVAASCYFWNAGSDLQKSHMGLLRTLLAQITLELPGVVAEACPDRFYDRMEAGQAPWTTGELARVLNSVIESASGKGTNIRFCLFIDGLDEYTGDHNAIATFVNDLSQKPHVKVCIASRELNTFVYHFSPKTNRHDAEAGCGSDGPKRDTQVLRVHTHTKPDIFRYVRDKLGGEIQPVSFTIGSDEFRHMVVQICERSQGVFLWVHLVCRDILQGYINDDSWDKLLARIDSTPAGLEPYFERMFNNIDPKYSAETAVLLQICLDFGGKYHRDKLVDVQVGKVHWDGGTEELWDAIHVAMTETLSTEQIRAACGNLLEINDADIRFIHKTAHDFVADRADVLAEMLRRNDLNLLLYRYRFEWYRLGFNSNVDGLYLLICITDMAQYEYTTGKADAVFLDGLDAYLDDLYVEQCLWGPGDTLKMCLSQGISIYAATTLASSEYIGIEPVTAMNGISLPIVSDHLLPWLSRTCLSRETREHHADHIIPAQTVLWSALGWTDSEWVRRHKAVLIVNPRCINDLLRHGIPASAPIQPGSSLFSSTISQVWLHHLNNMHLQAGDSRIPAAENALFGFKKMIEKSNCCDHFFDERTDLSAEPVMRKIQKRRRCKMFFGLFPGPSALAAHWHCYLRGWLFILYLSIIGMEDFNIEPRALMAKSLPPGTHKRKRKPPTPTTPYYHGEILEWGDFLPLELYDFCDIMWPSTWLVLSIGIVMAISRVFMAVSRLLFLVLQLLGVAPSSASIAQDHTTFRLCLACCFLVSWALYAKATVYWRCRITVRLEYLIAREVDRRFVKKLAVWYFASFWLLWFFWRQLAGLYSSLAAGVLLPTFCFLAFLYIYK